MARLEGRVEALERRGLIEPIVYNLKIIVLHPRHDTEKPSDMDFVSESVTIPEKNAGFGVIIRIYRAY